MPPSHPLPSPWVSEADKMSPTTRPTRYAVQAWIKDNLLLIATVSGVIMGVILGTFGVVLLVSTAANMRVKFRKFAA